MVVEATLRIGIVADVTAVAVGLAGRVAGLLVLDDLLAAEVGVGTEDQISVFRALNLELHLKVLVHLALRVQTSVRARRVLVEVLFLVTQLLLHGWLVLLWAA